MSYDYNDKYPPGTLGRVVGFGTFASFSMALSMAVELAKALLEDNYFEIALLLAAGVCWIYLATLSLGVWLAVKRVEHGKK